MARGRKSKSGDIFNRFSSKQEYKEALRLSKSAKSIYDNEFQEWCEDNNETLSFPPFNKEYKDYMTTIPKEELTVLENTSSSMKYNLHYSEIFEMIDTYTKLCQRGAYNSLIIHGTSGVGKSYTTLEATKEAISKAKTKEEKEKLSPLFLKGAVKTTRDLVMLLYKYREDRLIVLDDLDIKSQEMKNILKASLEDTNIRTITYLDNAKNVPAKERIPNHFTFTSRIIFITNMKRLDSALRDRGAIVKVDLTKEEILLHIKESFPTFLAQIPLDIKEEVWNFLMENKHKLKDISFRKFKVAVMNKLAQPTKWESWTMHSLNS